MAIRSFADKPTEELFFTGKPGARIGWKPVSPIARRKLDMLQFAARLEDLKSPPGNRLEALKGSLKGLHSIRINRQWRLVFRWTDAGAEDVRIADYH
jgi:proteic killer suppression protein